MISDRRSAGDVPSAGNALRLPPEAQLDRLLRALPRTPLLHLQGLGEPLLHPRLIPTLRRAPENGMHVTTSRNLTILDQGMARALTESGVDTVLTPPTPVIYRGLRAGPRLPAMQEARRLLSTS